MHRLLLLGLNHTTAPLPVREKLAFDAEQRGRAVEAFRMRFASSELVLLSTCNRVELYVGRGGETPPGVPELVELFSQVHGIPAEVFSEHLYHKSDRAVIEHLFAVASSLDSMVLGETQILGQVREAYDASRRAQAAGPLLNPLFQRAIGVGKQVLHETALAEGRLSIASVAVDYARRIFEHFADKTVLTVGAGKMAALVLQGFAALSPGRLLVCNRDPEKAMRLAARFEGQAVPFEDLDAHLIAADIVVTSTGSTHPILTRERFEALRKRRRYRPLFLIDIAVPRDVEATVGQVENVYLYNLDDLQQVIARTRTQRGQSIDAARKIVAAHVEEYAMAHRQRELGPVIDRLYRRYHHLAQEELDRTLGKLGPVDAAERKVLQEMTRRIVNKLLHHPVHTLRRSQGAHTTSAQYLHALEKLFRLDEKELTDPQPNSQPPEQDV